MNALASALEYRELGFSVLPLSGKRPHSDLIRRTHGGPSSGVVKRLAERGATEEQMRVWFACPGVNVGVFCGELSGGLVVVDFDDCAFPPRGMSLPLTPTVKTGRAVDRGYQLYYLTEAPALNRAFSWGEVRGWTPGVPAYVVAPPSIHPETGRRYGWQLPIGEVPFADFDDVLIPELASQAASKELPWEAPEQGSNNGICPTKALLLGPCTTRAEDPGEWLKSFDRDDNAVTAMAKALGIEAPLGHPFPCILHPDRTASASFHRSSESGHWLYHDFHAGRHGSREWLTLAQLRALKCGLSPDLSSPLHATMKLLLLGEADLLPPQRVSAPSLPASVPGFVRHVYERFLFLLGCRWNYPGGHGDPMPFDRKFAAAICRVSEGNARYAIDQLHGLGAIYVAAKDGRTRHWLAAGVNPPKANGNALRHNPQRSGGPDG